MGHTFSSNERYALRCPPLHFELLVVVVVFVTRLSSRVNYVNGHLRGQLTAMIGEVNFQRAANSSKISPSIENANAGIQSATFAERKNEEYKTASCSEFQRLQTLMWVCAFFFPTMKFSWRNYSKIFLFFFLSHSNRLLINSDSFSWDRQPWYNSDASSFISPSVFHTL